MPADQETGDEKDLIWNSLLHELRLLPMSSTDTFYDRLKTFFLTVLDSGTPLSSSLWKPVLIRALEPSGLRPIDHDVDDTVRQTILAALHEMLC